MKHAVAMALVGTLALATEAATGTTEVGRLVAALLGSTPMEEDLRVLTDEIGGRATGSEANRRSVEWALERFRNAGVDARAEAFTMPELWLERSTRISIEGDVTFGKTPFGFLGVRVAKMIGVKDGGGTIRNSEGGVNEKGVDRKSVV